MDNREVMRYCPKLIAVLEEAARTTEETRQIFRVHRKEIKRLLNDWCSPVRGDDLFESKCACKISGNDESDEIVKGVEDTLEYAQKLRKGIASGSKSEVILGKVVVSSANKFGVRSNGNHVPESYSSSCNFSRARLEGSACIVNGECRNRNHKATCRTFPIVSEVKNKKKDLLKSDSCRSISRSNMTVASGDTSSVRMRSNIPKPLAENSWRRSKVVSRTFPKPPNVVEVEARNLCTSCPSKMNSFGGRTSYKLKKCNPFQTTYQKDFSLHSRRVPSHSLQQGDVVAELCDMKVEGVGDVGLENGNVVLNTEKVYPLCSLSYVSASGTISGAELEKLIDKDAMKLVDNLVTNNQSPDTRGCQHFTPSMKSFGSLEEVLEMQGVPSELVSVLKSYHHFVTDLQDCPEVRSRTAANNFLDRLMNVNSLNWNNASYEPLAGLCSEYFELFGEVNNGRRNGETMSRIQEIFECLESACLRILNMDESVTPDSHAVSPSPRSLEVSAAGSCWITCGVWNAKTRDLLNDMMAVRSCVRYRNSHHLCKLHDNLQKIQILQLQLEVLEKLSLELLPLLKHQGGREFEFASVYKTCSALSNLITLVIPPIVAV